MTTQDSISLNLHPSFIEVNQKIGDTSQEKLIHYSQLGQILSSEKDLDTGLLPGEYGIQRMVIKDGFRYYMYLEPARIVSVNHLVGSEYEPDRDDYEDDEDYDEAMEAYENSGQKSYKFTSPALLWFVRIREGETRPAGNIYMYATKGPLITGLEEIFKVPYGNISEDSYVCWGSGNEIRFPTHKAIQGLSTVFFNAPANNDWLTDKYKPYDRKYMDGKATWPIHFHMDIEKMLEDKTETPESVLSFVESKLYSANMSANKAFERFIRN